MDVRYRLLLLLSFMLPLGLAGCSDDDEVIQIEEQAPELTFASESLRVKIGSENKVTLAVAQGGGEYKAFSLNPDIADVEIENGEIKVEGFANGQTEIVVSDKAGQYNKLPISVYTTEVLTFDADEIRFTTPLGHSKSATIHIVLGNGGYSITSDSELISASINEEGEITVTGTSARDEITGHVTISDCTGISATLPVIVNYTLVPFDENELEEIKATTGNTIRFNGDTNAYERWGGTWGLTTEDDGRLHYSWTYYSWAYWHIYFKGDKSVGAKEEATFACSMYNPSYQQINVQDQEVDLEIIQSDDTTVWAIFSFIKDEKLNYGYFISNAK